MKNNKLLNTLIKLLHNGKTNNKNRNRKGNHIRRILSNADYATNYGRIQSLGVGSSIGNIEYYFNQQPQANQQYGVRIGQILTGSSEFVDKMTHFRYFKILGLVVVFEPSYIGNGGEYVKVQMNYNENEADNMGTEDSTKIVPFYRIKRITLKYKMPDLQCLDPKFTINYTSWMTREIYNLNSDLPGLIWFSSTTGTPYAILCKIVLRVAFRGSVSVTPSSLNTELKILEENKDKNKNIIITKNINDNNLNNNKIIPPHH